MTDQTLDLTALRAVAQAATPGPWVTNDSDPLHPGPWVGKITHDRFQAYICETGQHGTSQADATYIATYDPPTVTAMLDVVQEVAFYHAGCLSKTTPFTCSICASLDALAQVLNERSPDA